MTTEVLVVSDQPTGLSVGYSATAQTVTISTTDLAVTGIHVACQMNDDRIFHCSPSTGTWNEDDDDTPVQFYGGHHWVIPLDGSNVAKICTTLRTGTMWIVWAAQCIHPPPPPVIEDDIVVNDLD